MDYCALDDNKLAVLSKTDDNALEELLLRYKGLVKSIARKFFIKGGDVEDLISEGMIGLCKAVRTFDEKGSAAFSTYAYVVVSHDMINAVKKQSSEKNLLIANALPIKDAEGKTGGVNPEEPIMFEDETKQLDNLLKSILSPLEYDVVNEYMAGLSYGEISKKLSVTTKSVDNALSRAKKKIAENLGE